MAAIKVAGIVCEYNPFHNGHAWMIEKLRKEGAEKIVCVMSGNYVQRAEPAFFPAHIRARAAIKGGADLVIRLPLPYSCASAEAFARAAVGVLCAMGCVDSVVFGAEDNDIEKIDSLAKVLIASDFKPVLKENLAKGVSFAVARSAAAEHFMYGAGKILQSPNNILGVEYCKALQYFAAGEFRHSNLPKPFSIMRKGAAHDGAPQDEVASASWLRRQLDDKAIEALKSWVPNDCLKIYSDADKLGERVSYKRWDIAQTARLKGMPACEMAKKPSAGEGLENRLALAVQASSNMGSVYSLTKTKRFAHSRIRRLALESTLDIGESLPAFPPFIQVLAVNKSGLDLLKTAKKTATVPLSTSLAKLAKTSKSAKDIISLEARAEDLYAFCQTVPQKGGALFTRAAFVIK